jgi:hypothetical protein
VQWWRALLTVDTAGSGRENELMRVFAIIPAILLGGCADNYPQSAVKSGDQVSQLRRMPVTGKAFPDLSTL